MTTNALSDIAKLALGATKTAPATDTLEQAMEIVRGQSAAVAALLFYGDEGGFSGCGVGDEAGRYPAPALTYLQQRLVQLRVPLAFNLSDGQVQYITRATAKQRRDYIAWIVPAADSWTELLILRGSWPADAIPPLLDFVDSALPALTIMMERFVGVDRTQRLERQLAGITRSVEALSQSAEVIGSVAAAYPTVQGLPEDQTELLTSLAEQAKAALEEVRANRNLMESHLRLQEYTSRLEQAVKKERTQATTDALTGLFNHRGSILAMEPAFEAAASDGSNLSLILGDIDGFKLFNDTYGHVSGDDVLKLVAGVFKEETGANGTVCRHGGDEFMIILPGHDKDAAIKIARRITERVGKAEFRTESNSTVPIRISLGVSSYPEDTKSPPVLVAIADAAMYEAKKRLQGPDESVVATGRDTGYGVLESLILAVDAKDRYTKDHCDLVAEYAVKLADRVKLSDDAKRPLRIAGLLHDIGKLALPDEVLKKPAPLTQEEYEVMQRHVKIGEALIREVPQMKDVIQAVSCHHERYDGTGYPRGLKGENIPLLGRIIAIADAYSAMCLDRPYRKALPHDRVISEIVAGAGIQFDPELAPAFVELLLEEQLQKKRPTAA